jgi:hypothetical protein
VGEQRTTKELDCVAMKRRIQEEIDAETRGMDAEELLGRFHRRVAASRFAALFAEGPDPAGEGAKTKPHPWPLDIWPGSGRPEPPRRASPRPGAPGPEG